MFVKPANWNKLTPEEKKKLRMDHWEKAEGVQFVSPEAEAPNGCAHATTLPTPTAPWRMWARLNTRCAAQG
jgi:hypothetical protein